MLYSSKPDRGRHIDRLATIAYLRGMDPHPIHNAKTLEIGCGWGKNSIAMAEMLPQASFLCIDPDASAIEKGTALVEKLGLKNISFQRRSIEDATFDGTFDYSICHGVYSWVSQSSREELLRKVKHVLNPQGVALISYNTFPGWYLRQTVRDLVRNADDPALGQEDRTQHAKKVLTWAKNSLTIDYDRPGMILLNQEIDRILKEPDAYLYNEFLVEENTAFYYNEFCSHCSEAELQVIGDSRFSRMSLNRLFQGEVSSAAFKEVHRLAAQLGSLEQAMDYLWYNVFRESIVTHAEASAPLEIDVSAIKGLSFSGYLIQEADTQNGEAEFRDAKGFSVVVANPLLRSALRILSSEYPSYVPFPKLLQQSQMQSSDERNADDEDEAFLEHVLLEWMQRDIVDFTLNPPQLEERVYAHPRASPFMRLQAEDSIYVVNIFHNTVELDSLQRELLKHLDGNQDREFIEKKAFDLITSGVGGIKEDGIVITDPERQKELLQELVEQALEQLRKAGLLTS